MSGIGSVGGGAEAPSSFLDSILAGPQLKKVILLLQEFLI